MRGVDAEEWVMMEIGNGMVHTWPVLLSWLLHYSHTYPIAETSYILVVLVATKKLEQHRELSESTNAYSCFLIAYPPSLPWDKHFWAAAYISPLVFVSISLDGRTDTRTVVLALIPCPCHPEPTDGLIHPLTVTIISAGEDVKRLSEDV